MRRTRTSTPSPITIASSRLRVKTSKMYPFSFAAERVAQRVQAVGWHELIAYHRLRIDDDGRPQVDGRTFVRLTAGGDDGEPQQRRIGSDAEPDAIDGAEHRAIGRKHEARIDHEERRRRPVDRLQALQRREVLGREQYEPAAALEAGHAGRKREHVLRPDVEVAESGLHPGRWPGRLLSRDARHFR